MPADGPRDEAPEGKDLAESRRQGSVMSYSITRTRVQVPASSQFQLTKGSLVAQGNVGLRLPCLIGLPNEQDSSGRDWRTESEAGC